MGTGRDGLFAVAGGLAGAAAGAGDHRRRHVDQRVGGAAPDNGTQGQAAVDGSAGHLAGISCGCGARSRRGRFGGNACGVGIKPGNAGCAHKNRNCGFTECELKGIMVM